MTKATTFIATAPDGAQFKRTSLHRTYSHAILARSNYEYALEQALKISGIDKNNWDYAAEVVAYGDKNPHRSLSPAEIERYKARVANYTRDSYAIAQRDARVALIEAQKKAGHYETWSAVTWCGRPDLAGKELARAKREPWYAEAVAAEAKAV